MSALEVTLAALARHLVAIPECDSTAIFDSSFLAQVPAPQIEGLLQRLVQQLGNTTGHEILARLPNHAARVRWTFERGCHIDGMVAVSEKPPHKIVFLNFGLPTRADDSWTAIERAVGTLAGQSTFAICDLSDGAVLASVEPDLTLGSGSISKLLIFSTLLAQIAAGQRRWDEVIVLQSRHLSAPSGIMHSWPVGSPLTLHTAAVLLLLMSDNTSADLLLDQLGRANTEAGMDAIGVGSFPRSRPFFSTRGLFHLVVAPAEVQAAYCAAGETQRRALLAEAESKQPQMGDQTTEMWPEGFDWYFSAHEVCRVLGFIRHQVARDPVGKAIFGINPSGIASEQWSFVGYKGGSSPGRLALSALLEDKDGHGFAVCLINNTTPETLNLEACATLIKRATDLALVRR